MQFKVEMSASGKTFNIALYKSEGDEKPAAVFKGHKLATTKDGKEFVTGPSAKMDDGKWFNYSYFGEAFGNYILKLVKEEQKASKNDDIDSDLPF